MKVCAPVYCDPGEGCYKFASSEPTKSKDETVLGCHGHVPRNFIFECNLTCPCSRKCRNRVVQKGLNAKLAVFWTDGCRRWGVKTLQPIAKGTFVVAYHGEIVSNAEIMRRYKPHDKANSYTCSLDADWRAEAASNDDQALSIDGLMYGNVARFFNHRCEDANLLDMPVKVDFSDPRFFTVAYFAKTDIQIGEELTWVSSWFVITCFCGFELIELYCGSMQMRDL